MQNKNTALIVVAGMAKLKSIGQKNKAIEVFLPLYALSAAPRSLSISSRPLRPRGRVEFVERLPVLRRDLRLRLGRQLQRDGARVQLLGAQQGPEAAHFGGMERHRDEVLFGLPVSRRFPV